MNTTLHVCFVTVQKIDKVCFRVMRPFLAVCRKGVIEAVPYGISLGKLPKQSRSSGLVLYKTDLDRSDFVGHLKDVSRFWGCSCREKLRH